MTNKLFKAELDSDNSAKQLNITLIKLKNFIQKLEKNISKSYISCISENELNKSLEYVQKLENCLYKAENSTKPFDFDRELYLRAVGKNRKVLVFKPSYHSLGETVSFNNAHTKKKTNAIPKKPCRNRCKVDTPKQQANN